MKKSIEVRFWQKVDKTPGLGPYGDCWEWTAALTGGKKGDGPEAKYGAFAPIGTAVVLAHRFAFELTNGPVSEGLFVCHSCDNRHCVNPSHLEAKTHLENMADMVARGRQARRWPALDEPTRYAPAARQRQRPIGPERFWQNVDKAPGFGPKGDCWRWAGTQVGGAETGQKYGGFYPAPKEWASAHRYSFELAYGPIPEGLFVRHRCDNTLCVNPAHLLSGTHQDNMNDMSERGRHGMAAKVCCPRGHEYTAENTRLTSKGGRVCRLCMTRQKRMAYLMTHYNSEGQYVGRNPK